MKTITVKIQEKLDLQLQSLSKRRKISKSRIVRDAIRDCLKDEVDSHEYSAYDLMKDGIGTVKSKYNDLASSSKHMNGFGE